MNFSAIWQGMKTADIVRDVYGLTDKSSREYKSASRQVQRLAKAERENRVIRQREQNIQRFTKAAEAKAKPVEAKPPALPIPTQLDRVEERAGRQLEKFDPGTRVVISVTTKDGRSVILGKHGGINVDVIPSGGSVGFAAGQAVGQAYDLDDDDIVSIDFEDFEDFY